jgi:cadmium resistance protein CadD (predicted permease)
VWARGQPLITQGDRHSDDSGCAVCHCLGRDLVVVAASGRTARAPAPPRRRTLRSGAGLITVAVFAAGVALWCATGAWLGSHKKVIATVERVGHWLIPVVFITIGIVILIKSGVTTRLF